MWPFNSKSDHTYLGGLIFLSSICPKSCLCVCEVHVVCWCNEQYTVHPLDKSLKKCVSVEPNITYLTQNRISTKTREISLLILNIYVQILQELQRIF